MVVGYPLSVVSEEAFCNNLRKLGIFQGEVNC